MFVRVNFALHSFGLLFFFRKSLRVSPGIMQTRCVKSEIITVVKGCDWEPSLGDATGNLCVEIFGFENTLAFLECRLEMLPRTLFQVVNIDHN